MRKYKSFSLFSSYESGCQIRIEARIYPNGTFNTKGNIDINREYNLRCAKNTAKRREMGFNLISLIHEGCGCHHVNRNDVVAIPKDIHAAIPHALSDGTALKLEGVVG